MAAASARRTRNRHAAPRSRPGRGAWRRWCTWPGGTDSPWSAETAATARGLPAGPPGASGYARTRTPAQAITALAHQLGHVLLHGQIARLDPGGTVPAAGLRKVEADSVAYLVAAHLGIDTAAIAFPYVSSWAGTDPRARPAATVETVSLPGPGRRCRRSPPTWTPSSPPVARQAGSPPPPCQSRRADTTRR